MRHDFRIIYGCSYDEVDIEEAIDLIKTLPDGSFYIARMQPERSWTQEQHLVADIRDTLWHIAYAQIGIEDYPRVLRPADIQANIEARKKAQSVKEILNRDRTA